MFAQTFCDSPPELLHRKWITLLSFSLEALTVMALITMPLLHIDTLPPSRAIAAVFTPIMPAEPVEIHSSNHAQEHSSVLPLGELSTSRIMQPGRIPSTSSTEDPAVQPPAVPWGDPNAPNPLHEITGMNVPVRPVAAMRPKVSIGVMEGALTKKVQPVYPRLATLTHLEGSVVLQAIISRTGAVENLQVISGNPYFSQAALDAVRQWRYRPYRLDGEPVEVETQIVVKFVLGRD
jgi:protein TonB